MNELVKTAIWNDVLVSLATAQDPEADIEEIKKNPPEHLMNDALFITLRTLHAQRAEMLAQITITPSKENKEIYLIEDDGIRNRLGEIIGQIAASHNWPLDKTMLEFEGDRGAPTDFPYRWSVSPLRIACLLRCSDAVQIDQARAPDFLYALLQANGVSEKHWRAQNRLATVTPDRKDPALLLFTSTKSFLEEDAEAWWIAHDAIVIADKELDECSRLLRDLDLPIFQINGVKDARSPLRLANSVKAKGWRPVRAKPKMGNTSNIINMMGGAQLYGQDPIVPLRELIQNSADAIRARKADAHDPSYTGRIIIRLVPHNNEVGSQILSFEDDGIGMSEQVLTGPMIEFGTSYWKSDLIRRERPGLISSFLRQSGGFGVGFFSCFMVSDRISVTSRMYDASVGDFRTLEFKGGLHRHPILLDGARPSATSSTSTRVSICLADDTINSMLSMPNRHFSDDRKKISLQQLVAHIAPCVDCDILFAKMAPNRSSCTHTIGVL